MCKGYYHHRALSTLSGPATSHDMTSLLAPVMSSPFSRMSSCNTRHGQEKSVLVLLTRCDIEDVVGRQTRTSGSLSSLAPPPLHRSSTLLYISRCLNERTGSTRVFLSIDIHRVHCLTLYTTTHHHTTMTEKPLHSTGRGGMLLPPLPCDPIPSHPSCSTHPSYNQPHPTHPPTSTNNIF